MTQTAREFPKVVLLLRSIYIKGMVDSRNKKADMSWEDKILLALRTMIMEKKKEILPMTTDYRFGKSTQHGIWCYNQAIEDCASLFGKE